MSLYFAYMACFKCMPRLQIGQWECTTLAFWTPEATMSLYFIYMGGFKCMPRSVLGNENAPRLRSGQPRPRSHCIYNMECFKCMTRSHSGQGECTTLAFWTPEATISLYFTYMGCFKYMMLAFWTTGMHYAYDLDTRGHDVIVLYIQRICQMHATLAFWTMGMHHAHVQDT